MWALWLLKLISKRRTIISNRDLSWISNWNAAIHEVCQCDNDLWYYRCYGRFVEWRIFEKFFPSRLIHQVDPLSPYLFVICMKRLSYLIEEAISNKQWKPVPICRNGPKLSSLLFADDLILFSEATLDQAMVIKRCLHRFCEASRRKVNQNKSRIFFSTNIG